MSVLPPNPSVVIATRPKDVVSPSAGVSVRCKSAVTAAAVTLISVAGPIRAQSPDAATSAPVQWGPLGLSPVIQLANLGYDSNVLQEEDNVTGDFTATLSPAVEAGLRLPRLRVTGRSRFDFFYFKELTDLRGTDTDNAARLEVPLNRLTPFVEGTYVNTRHRLHLEIDEIAARRTSATTVGADVRLTAKISAGAYATRSRLEYEPDPRYPESDLARQLNSKAELQGVAVRYALTPFTKLAVDFTRQQDRFEFEADRDSESSVVIPSVEFAPLALVTGRAAVGFESRTFPSGETPDFNGMIALVDLNYVLLGRTRFGVAARRDLEYSGLVGQTDYIVVDVTASITQRLGDSWGVGGFLGRARLTYRQGDTSTTQGATALPAETIPTYGVNFGYSTAHTRVEFLFEHRARRSDLPEDRGYQRSRIGSTLTYEF